MRVTDPRPRMLALVLVHSLGICACATVRHEQSYGCQVEEPPHTSWKTTQPMVVDGPEGRFELELAHSAGARKDADGEPSGAAVRLIADGVPLAKIALRLSEVLGLSISVEPEVAQLRFYLRLREASLAQLLAHLQVHPWVGIDQPSPDRIVFQRWDRWWQRIEREAREQYRKPRVERLIPVKGPVRARQFAELFCRESGEVGDFVTAGDDYLLVTGAPEAVLRIEGIMVNVEDLETSGMTRP